MRTAVTWLVTLAPIPFAAAIVAANVWYREGACGPEPETTRARQRLAKIGLLAMLTMLLAAGVVRFVAR